MTVLIITLHFAATTMVAMAFEWIWAQKLVTTRSKVVMCQAYWMVLSVVAFVSTSPLNILTLLALAGVGATHLDLVRKNPNASITLRTLVTHIPRLVSKVSQRFLKQ